MFEECVDAVGNARIGSRNGAIELMVGDGEADQLTIEPHPSDVRITSAER